MLAHFGYTTREIVKKEFSNLRKNVSELGMLALVYQDGVYEITFTGDLNNINKAFSIVENALC